MVETSSPLVQFLLARIEEDELIARFVRDNSPTADKRFCTWATPVVMDPDRLVVAVDYQRVLAECAAKRHIIDAYLEVEHHPSASSPPPVIYSSTIASSGSTSQIAH